MSSLVALWAAYAAGRQASSAQKSADYAKEQTKISEEQLGLAKAGEKRNREVNYYALTQAFADVVKEWTSLLVKILVEDAFKTDQGRSDVERLDHLRSKVFEANRVWLPVKSEGPYSDRVEVLTGLITLLPMVVDEDSGALVSRIFQIDPTEMKAVAEYASQVGNYTLNMGRLAVQITDDVWDLTRILGEWISDDVADA